MDKIISARIDDAVDRKILELAHKLKTSKKAVIERAINLLWKRTTEQEKTDVFSDTSGAWQRDESAADTVARIRGEVNESMRRHQR